MGPAISDVLALAIGVMISPLPIVAVILMLFSARARGNGPAFLLGWVLGLSVVAAIVYLLAHASDAGTDSSAADGFSTVKMVLGGVLVVLAVRRWRKRPAPGTEPHMPKWMASLESFSPPKAFGLGALLSSINPKNLALTIAAAASVGQANLSTGDSIVVLVVFVAIGSLSIIVPVTAYLAGGQRAEKMLGGWRTWLVRDNAIVMAVLLLVFGVVVFSQGLRTVTA